jgi:hypothetical protein
VSADGSQCVGTYFSNDDPSEKVYAYSFELWNSDELVDQTGILLHNASNDIKSNESSDIWKINKMLTPGDYTYVYNATTINGLKVSVGTSITIEDSQ